MQIILGNFCSLFTTGLVLAAIFQMAHIVENISFPTPNEEGQMENNYIRHQLNTTSNFATNSKFIAYLFGGLNFQIEHHLFPYLSHIHLYNIAPIVKATAKELGLPYKEYPTYWAALKSHFRMLKKLGKKI